jgi:catechol 2,3-dioxygenase-like lactoylglutathione lyase family enzyme
MEDVMALSLDHTIVPANDKEESVRFIARILGLEYNGPWGHFAPLKINDTLTFDFDNQEKCEGHHYAFLASDGEFDAILQRVKDQGVSYGSGPFSQDDGKINHLHQGRGFYFHDANGHSWEIITHTYITESS